MLSPPGPSKITILLADEDALRRDGLAAVLADAEGYEVVARVPDGNTALQEIRVRRPDVAVVDLHLAGMHAIELVRRIRSESIPTRVVILAGTNDDEIVREVVRAGGDGYLLKNGPARHLLDAISYVRDGGQYFSPQLHRDGRDRHLLQEPARQPTVQADEGEERATVERPASRRGRAGGRPKPGVWRERIREEARSSNLEDRDYEIMSMMADGIRPILDRMDEIDNRVALMEVGDAPLPAHPREWLSHELADSLEESSGGKLVPLGTRELEARLPEMIEEAVTNRFNQMAGRLQQQIEETHVRTLETFVKNIQVKLVRRVSALEEDMSKQAEAMTDLRQSTQRTEDNLSRLIHGVDKLAQELPQRFATAALPVAAPPSAAPPSAAPPSAAARTKSRSSKRTRNIIFAGLMAMALVGLGVLCWWKFLGPSDRATPTETDAASVAVAAAADDSAATRPANVAPPAANAPSKTKLEAAKNYVDLKNYAMGEDLYKQVIASEPANVEALQGLASVLYREDKIEEAAAILDRIPK
jgi:DNA-binding NarL/FixJ family response regulator